MVFIVAYLGCLSGCVFVFVFVSAFSFVFVFVVVLALAMDDGGTHCRLPRMPL